jgi:predicted dehydrogenase
MSTNEALRVGLIGAGGMAEEHLRAYEQFPERVRLAAICDLDEERARKLAAEAGVSADDLYTDSARMLSEAEIDAVFICTLHDQHAPLALAAIESGRHVLTEKPLATSIEDSRKMVDAAERAGVQLMVGQNQRFVPAFQAAHAAIAAGELGELRAARCDAMQSLPGFLPPTHWIYDSEKAGGGIVISVGIHRIDLLRYLVGDVAQVTALTRSGHPDFPEGTEDYAVALLEFENGAIGEVFATYSGFRVPWIEQTMVFGDAGIIHGLPSLGNSPLGDTVMIASSKRQPVEPSGWETQFEDFEQLAPTGDLPTDDDIVNEVLHFADCCASGEEPLTSGRDNLGTMAVVLGIYESGRTGKPVEIKAR